MSSNLSCFVWNVRGLNGCARRNVVREFLVQQRATVVCLQETKLSTVCTAWANEILGTMFDYDFVPAINVSGGNLLGWHRDHWSASGVVKGRYSLSAKLTPVGSQVPWWITVVYGPQLGDEKVEFLNELLLFRETNLGPWLLCGDFNMIYQAEDKNNDRLDRRNMRRFRAFINMAHL